MASLTRNYIFNVINTVMGIVFPLITFPYASRILEADGIGIVNFYSSIVSYISLVTCLGIPLYATREIAKVKHDPKLLSSTANEILLLHILLTIGGYLVVAILCFTVPKIAEDKALFLVLSASILFTTMGCDWFFRGTEDFKYITIRGLIVRIIYIPLLFIFVKTRNDLLIYGILTVGVSVGNNVFNFYRLTGFVRIKEITEVVNKPFKHLKGAASIFIMNASVSLYLQLNIVVLGFLSSNTNVGYFTAASKMTLVVAGFITALQTTIVPRISSLISNSEIHSVKLTLKKVLNFIFIFGFPVSAGLIVMSPVIIKLFAGPDFTPAVVTLQILSFNLVLSVFNGFLCSGILVPQNKEKIATIACLVGGVLNLIVNIVLIPVMAQNGTAIASIAAEAGVAVGMILLGRKFIPIVLWDRAYNKYIIAALIMFVACYFLNVWVDKEAFTLTAIPVAGAVIYCFLLFIFRDKFFDDIIRLVLRHVGKLKKAN